MKGKIEIKVQGYLDKQWMESFQAIEIEYQGDDTILIVQIKDESHLHGILNLIRDLNLTLISVNPVAKSDRV
jgi:hypothetical protein